MNLKDKLVLINNGEETVLFETNCGMRMEAFRAVVQKVLAALDTDGEFVSIKVVRHPIQELLDAVYDATKCTDEHEAGCVRVEVEVLRHLDSVANRVVRLIEESDENGKL